MRCNQAQWFATEGLQGFTVWGLSLRVCVSGGKPLEFRNLAQCFRVQGFSSVVCGLQVKTLGVRCLGKWFVDYKFRLWG